LNFYYVDQKETAFVKQIISAAKIIKKEASPNSSDGDPAARQVLMVSSDSEAESSNSDQLLSTMLTMKNKEKSSKSLVKNSKISPN
jgi:hypothetical protein